MEPIKYEFTGKGDLFDLTFRITENCNYGCGYCDYFSNQKGVTHTEIEDLLINFIKEELSGKSIRLCIYGGEPTLHPRIIEICKKLSPYISHFGIQTNLSMKKEDLVELMSEVPNLNFIPTYHTERVKDVKDFWTKLLLIHRADRLWHCAFLLPLKTFDEDFKLFKDFYMVFREKMHPQPLTFEEAEWFRIEELKPYLKSQSSMIKRTYKDGSVDYVSLMEWRNHQQDQVQGWDCTAGKDLLFVDWDGRVYKCLSELYQGQAFAHLGQKNLISDKTKKCSFDYCGFSTDMTIRK